MDVGILILIGIIAAVFFLVLNLFKSLIKVITITLVIVLALGLLFGYIITQDAKTFAHTFKTEPTTYILVNERPQLGFQAVAFNTSTFHPLNDDELENVLLDKEGIRIFVNQSILDTNKSYLGISTQDLLTSSDEELRSRAFMLAFFDTIKRDGPISMFSYVRNKSIEIKPNTVTILMLTSTPRQVFKAAKQEFVQVANETLQTVQDSYETKKGEST